MEGNRSKSRSRLRQDPQEISGYPGTSRRQTHHKAKDKVALFLLQSFLFPFPGRLFLRMWLVRVGARAEARRRILACDTAHGQTRLCFFFFFLKQARSKRKKEKIPQRRGLPLLGLIAYDADRYTGNGDGPSLGVERETKKSESFKEKNRKKREEKR